MTNVKRGRTHVERAGCAGVHQRLRAVITPQLEKDSDAERTAGLIALATVCQADAEAGAGVLLQDGVLEELLDSYDLDGPEVRDRRRCIVPAFRPPSPPRRAGAAGSTRATVGNTGGPLTVGRAAVCYFGHGHPRHVWRCWKCLRKRQPTRAAVARSASRATRSCAQRCARATSGSVASAILARRERDSGAPRVRSA